MIFSRKIFHQTLAATNVNLNELMTGIGYGWMAPTLISLQNGNHGFSLSAKEISWLASLHEVSHTVGPILSIVILDRIGRKNCLIVASFLLFLTWLLTIFANSISLMYTARLIFGLAISINEFTSPVYLAENSSPNIRGVIYSLLSLFYYGGVFVEFIVATYLPYTSVAIVNTLLGAITLLTTFQLKETPYYLMMKGRKEAATKTLTWLNGQNVSQNEIETEIEKISQNIEAEKLKKKSYLTLFSSPENYKSMLTVFIINLLWVLTGYNAIVSYASTIFVSSSVCTANEFTILMGIVHLVAACFSPFIVERFNRRSLLIISCLIIGLSHGSAFILFKTELAIEHIYFPWLIFASVAAYSFTAALVYPAVLITRGELLPISVKAIGGFLVVTMESLGSFATIHLFSIITEGHGIEFNFLLYCIAGFLECAYIYFRLPETRGKSLLDIQKSLSET